MIDTTFVCFFMLYYSLWMIFKLSSISSAKSWSNFLSSILDSDFMANLLIRNLSRIFWYVNRIKPMKRCLDYCNVVIIFLRTHIQVAEKRKISQMLQLHIKWFFAGIHIVWMDKFEFHILLLDWNKQEM